VKYFHGGLILIDKPLHGKASGLILPCAASILNGLQTNNTFVNPLAKLVLGVPTGSAKHQLGP